MALLPILRFPDPKLNTVAKPVAAVDARIKSLVADMLETMYDANGIGLAATQVDVHERLVVIDVSEERDEPLVLINPEITWASPDKQKNDEGCLSVPKAGSGRSRPRACCPSASSTRWTTCWARCSSSTCLRSSGTASRPRCSNSSARTVSSRPQPARGETSP